MNTNLVTIFGGSGWVKSTTLPDTAVTVILQIDNLAVTTTQANVARNDVGPHGFVFSTPPMSSGQHQISIIAIDPVTGILQFIGAKVITT